MSCYSPLRAFPSGELTREGKIKYIITPTWVHHLEKNKNGSYTRCADSFFSSHACDIVSRFIEVPCGKCLGCRLDKSREWANRCMMELKYHQESYFLTLTYDDLHLPTTEFVDEDGVITNIPTLVKKDFQDFIKRLRTNLERRGDTSKIRYYGCGEYGTDTHRPHFHIIVFGLHLDDLKLYSRNSQGYNYYNSAFLDSCWQGRGFIVVGHVTWETCAYTARYVMKKANASGHEWLDFFGVEPEFTLMSLKPGIGAQFYIDHPNCMDFDEISISTDQRGISFKPPRYFEKLYDVDHPQSELPFYKKYDSLAQKLAESNRQAKLSQTSLNYQDMLAVEGDAKANTVKSLTRKGV